MKEERQNQNLKTYKGITLIALVVTIIVLLILAAISITAVFGENGLITMADKAKKETEKGLENDTQSIKDLGAFINEQTGKGEDLNNIIDVIGVTADNEGNEKILVITEDKKIKCITGNKVKVDELTKVNMNNIKTISKVEPREKGDDYFIDNLGNLYVWGNNAYKITENTDMICANNVENSALKGKNVVKFCNGFAIDSEGKVYSWGYNYHGELGNGTTEPSTTPICISDVPGSPLNGKVIVKIESMSNYSNYFAIDSEGKVYSWGNSNYKGQLGNGTTEASYMPICISDIEESSLYGKKVIEVQGENESIRAVDENGNLHCWGNGKLLPICSYYNTEESGLEYKNIKQVVGDFVLDNQGKVYYLGENVICLSNTEESVINGKNIKNIVGAVALDDQGKIYSLYDDICLSDTEESAFYEKKIVYIEYYEKYGHFYITALDDQGRVYMCGDNSYGQLGNGTQESSDTPICISDIPGSLLNGKAIVKIEEGVFSPFAMDNEGKCYTWGYNALYLFSRTEEMSYDFMPICINDIENSGLKDKKIKKVICKDTLSIFLTEEGEIFYLAIAAG